MRLPYRSIVATSAAFVLSFSSALPVSARVLEQPAQTAAINLRDITWGTVMNRKVYLPGKWTVRTADDIVTFVMDSRSVAFSTISADDCTYEAAKTRARKAWGTSTLDQNKGRLETIILGRVQYRGFKWLAPGKPSGTEYHWCMQQDVKTAVEIVTTSPKKDLLDFINVNLLRQFAGRSSQR